MRELLVEYRDKYNLDVTFMRCEYAVILDPSESNRIECEKIVERTRRENGAIDEKS